MSEAQTAVEHLNKAINAKNREALKAALDPACEMFSNGELEVKDPDEYWQLLEGFYRVFPDLKHTTHDMFADGDKVAERWTTSGRHDGEFLGIAPTGRFVEFSGTSTYVVADGRVVEERTNVDILSILVQIGAVSLPVEQAAVDA